MYYELCMILIVLVSSIRISKKQSDLILNKWLITQKSLSLCFKWDVKFSTIIPWVFK